MRQPRVNRTHRGGGAPGRHHGDDGTDVDAVVLVGTNLPTSRVAAKAEFWLSKPVIGLDADTYWHALRQNGRTDRMLGFGRLLAEF